MGNNRSKGRTKKSYMTYIFLGLLALVVIGDIIGAVLYLRQGSEVREQLLQYVGESARGSASFFGILGAQMLYQLTIWGLGLSIIGNLANIGLVFMRGISAGFNLAFLFATLGFGASLLWILQYGLVLMATVFSAYFSMRFAFLMIENLIFKRSMKLFKRHLKYYCSQLVIIVVMTLITATVSYVVNPIISDRLNNVSTESVAVYVME